MFFKPTCFVVLMLSLLLVNFECRAGQPESGKSRSAQQVSRLQRAGNPHTVAWYAVPSINKRYMAYYIGGGAAVKGEHRHPEEGTWGLDYIGHLFKRRVNLGWWHGRHKQDGGGSYKPDGPHVLKH